MTALLVPPAPLAAAAILYLIFGDGIASIAGKSIGGPRWPNSNKRVSGSLACFIACVLVGIIVMWPSGYGWPGIVIGALTASFFEIGFIKLNDNFILPLVSSIAFVLTYNLWSI